MRRFALLLLVVIGGCKKDVATTDAAFWDWVRAHTEELKEIRTGQEPIADALSAELQKAAPGLVFELGVGTDPFEFIISADGIEGRFADVKRLTAAAGQVPGMKVIAFRPRKHVAGFEMQLGALKLAAADVKFTAAPDERPGKLALVLYVDGFTPATSQAIEKAGYVLLDAAIGEYDMETKIGTIDFKAPPAPEAAKPLPELPSVVDAHKK